MAQTKEIYALFKRTFCVLLLEYSSSYFMLFSFLIRRSKGFSPLIQAHTKTNIRLGGCYKRRNL